MRFLGPLVLGSWFIVGWLGVLVGWNFVDAERPWLIDMEYNMNALNMTEAQLRMFDPTTGLGLMLVRYYCMTGFALIGMSLMYICIILISTGSTTRNTLLLGVVGFMWSAWMALMFAFKLEITTASVHRRHFMFAAGLQFFGTLCFFVKQLKDIAWSSYKDEAEKDINPIFPTSSEKSSLFKSEKKSGKNKKQYCNKELFSCGWDIQKKSIVERKL